VNSTQTLYESANIYSTQKSRYRAHGAGLWSGAQLACSTGGRAGEEVRASVDCNSDNIRQGRLSTGYVTAISGLSQETILRKPPTRSFQSQISIHHVYCGYGMVCDLFPFKAVRLRKTFPVDDGAESTRGKVHSRCGSALSANQQHAFLPFVKSW
jgi:hypothetical protein